MVCYLMNKSLFTAIEIKTLIEVWLSIPIDYSILKIFGCPIYAYASDRNLEKMALKYVFLDYQYEIKDYSL